MKCRKMKKMMNEMIDGTLPEKDKLKLSIHLKQCPDCRKLYNDLSKLVKAADELQELSPSSQVWLNIQAGLSQSPVPERKTKVKSREKTPSLIFSPALRYGLSAALILFALTGLVAVLWMQRGGDNMAMLTPDEKYTLSKLEEADRYYRKAIKALTEAVEARKAEIDPQVLASLQANLEIIDSSIEACRQAVLNQPQNIDAQNYLLASYKEKVDLLDRMLTLESSSGASGQKDITI